MRIGSQAAGRISEVLVALNDKVGAGEILVRLDDGELIARVHAATAELAIRRRDRDGNESTGRLAQDRRTAEDNVASAERQLVISREEYDRSAKARRTGGATPADVDKARDVVVKAQERLDTARLALRKALSVDNLPAPTRQEAAVTAGSRRAVAGGGRARAHAHPRADSPARRCRSVPRSARRPRPRPRTCW